MKILYVTTIGSTMGFFPSLVRELLDEGHTVDIAANLEAKAAPDCYRDWGCKLFQISTSRSPFSSGNIRAVGQIKKLVAEGGYNIVHCHTPIAAACTRLACRTLRKQGVKVVYTAHGFHFYTGAPIQNWLIFYPIEKLCARWTDVLITINREDYARAKKKLPARKVAYIPGVGIDIQKFSNAQPLREAKREALCIPKDAFLLCSVGELNANKNHEVVLRAMARLNRQNVHYIIAGVGDKREHLLQLAKELQLTDQLHLLGFRTDVAELYKTADLFVFPSFREGLPVSVMEAMAAGLPVVCSGIRGNTDLVADGESGCLFDPSNQQSLTERIETLMDSPELLKKMGGFNARRANDYSKEIVNAQMHQIYQDTVSQENRL